MTTSVRLAVACLSVAVVVVGLLPAAASARPSPSHEVRQDQDRPPTAAPAVFTSRLERGERAAVPEDRYAMAGGCYAVRSLVADRYLIRGDGTFSADGGTATAEPFHLQATDLGHYLLFATERDFLAAQEGALAEGVDQLTDNSVAAMVDGVTRGGVQEASGELARSPLNEGSGRGDTVIAAGRSSELADWEIDGSRNGFRLTLPPLGAALVVDGTELVLVPVDEAGEAGLFSFALTDGCAEWPEVDVNVDGPIVGGSSPWGEARGYLDGHLHGMAFEFLGGRARCGRPWHPYGVEFALQGCPEHEDSGGRTNLLETALTGTVNPVEGHDTQGWPTFNDWPQHNLLTYEQVYYRWLERSWRGGLRMFVNLLVDNYVLCEVYPFKVNSCNEMDGVRLQAERIREFERYIDAQHGGPGEGWLRIVTDPFEARRVMNEGRLAVVLGIEVSRPFDCRLVADQPQCDEDQIDHQIDEVHALGVRQMELVNKFDNALTGVKGDAGDTGLIVNGGNVIETGRFWKMETCDEEDHDHDHGDEGEDPNGHSEGPSDNPQHNVHDATGSPDELTGRDALAGVVLQETGRSGAAPLYGPSPHCNIMGLTDLGEHTIRRMAGEGMIFDPDHMSARARHEAMDLIEEIGYSGVISSHSWADDIIYERIYEAGGVVTPMAGSSTRFLERWRSHREWADPRFLFGFGFGSDINGFARQGAPRDPDEGDAVSYPFTGFGGVSIDRQVSGERVFDVNTDGVAHYGMYPDWVEDIRLIAGDEAEAFISDLERGPEAYLQVWERATGVAPDACRPDVADLEPEQIAAVPRGASPEEVLRALGQPADRTDGVFRYCLADGRTAAVAFDETGAVSHTRLTASEDPVLPVTGGGVPVALILVALSGVVALRRVRPGTS